LASLDTLVALGCERVLTSGAQASAIEGAGLIRQLVELSAGRIVVMPGAGVDAGNIGKLRELTGATEFHASAKRQHPSAMQWQPALLKGMQGGELRSDVEQVRGLAAALNAAAASR
jgi:copper homeostasis protein